ncbi:MFS transporter [Pedobacter sp. Hv1]|uniref:MFS transporter n=1 Tax=Pedobacter sp. Hv1 TaxID=1740090 RepID=UPI0006D8CA9D|nr:MFS transporter [Pedobacter sp. Hv1]KQB99932.1 MFS transporter [Pedobacter sp. Hv1]
MNSNSVKRAAVATRAIFLVCGLGIASWAPMVPLVKERLGINDASLGLLLLFLGGGAISMMPISGILGHKYGSRILILAASLVLALMLPLLLLFSSVLLMGVALFIFGAAVGTLDVAMNSHAVQVQNKHGKHIMSAMHGLFSVGGLLGSLGLGFLIKLGLQPMYAAVSIALLIVVIVCSMYSSLFTLSVEKEIANNEQETEELIVKPVGKFLWLHASVLSVGAMCFAAFLAEGSILDWSAVFLKENRGVEEAFAGMGYAAFSLAMATMRLLGDGLIHRLNAKKIVVGGGLIAAFGLFLAVIVPNTLVSLLGFVLLGIGAANIVPVFFTEAGKLKQVPAAIAIPAITTIGYAGQLAGPALLGVIAHHFSLPIALGFSGFLLMLVAIVYWRRR